MAAFINLTEIPSDYCKKNIKEEICNAYSDIKDNLEKEYLAARKIQSWVRGYLLRKEFRKVLKSAILVQKTWRGYIGRKNYREKLKEHVQNEILRHYHDSACQIQKMWRGYYTRKYIHNYYELKKYLQFVEYKNEQTKEQLRKYENEQLERLNNESVEKENDRRKIWAERHHFLLSTHQIDGIYRKPNLKDEEYLLMTTKPRDHKQNQQTVTDYSMQQSSCLDNVRDRIHAYNTSENSSMGSETVTQNQLYFGSDQTCRPYELKKVYRHYDVKSKLPPLPTKPQKSRLAGPFRDPVEVHKQRFKELQPTLRVQTDFYSLEKARDKLKQDEWTKRLSDEKFIPIYKPPKGNVLPNLPTDPTLAPAYRRGQSTTSDAFPKPLLRVGEYIPLLDSQKPHKFYSYGTEHFRKYEDDGNPFSVTQPAQDVWCAEELNEMNKSNFVKTVSTKDFKLIVPPVPIFDRLNDTYSTGQVT